MTITLYVCTSDPKCVTKTLTNAQAVSGVVKDPVNVINPVIEVELDNGAAASYNYAYIQEYGRYYFIEPQNDSYKLNTLMLRCDVLMSSGIYLKTRNATISRNERMYNSYLNDANFKSYAYKNIVTKSFPNGIFGDSIILMTVGGGGV